MFRACQVFAHRLLTFSRCQCCPIPAPLDPPGASIMTPCVRAAAVYALSHVAKVASLASFAGCALDADIANQTHRAHAARRAAYAQSAFHADQVDRARLALIAKDSRSATFASSANPANPATGKATATTDGLRVGVFGSASGFLDIISQSSTHRPSPLHLRQTPLHHTSCHRLHDLARRHRPPLTAHSCIADFFQIKRSENVSAL
jgi:hypothetical protein